MEFKKVVTIDWNGKLGTYEVIKTVKHDNNKYSCVFKNSSGDIEKQLVEEIQLHLD